MAKTKTKAMQKPGATTREIASLRDIQASMGPGVWETPSLPVSGLRLLMRRVDLLVLAGSGVWPQPISSRVARIMTEGTGVQIEETKGDVKGIAEFSDSVEAVVQACIVEPPAEYVAGEIELAEIDVAALRPMFDAENPPRKCLHLSDMTQIATLAYAYGPGAHRFFR